MYRMFTAGPVPAVGKDAELEVALDDESSESLSSIKQSSRAEIV